MPDAILTEDEVTAIGNALGLLSSALRSGEPYSPAVTEAFNRAADALRNSRSPSPSVRLARWLDGSGLRRVVAMTQSAVGAWSIHLWCPRAGHVIEHGGSSRDRTITAALDQAEGVEHDRG